MQVVRVLIHLVRLCEARLDISSPNAHGSARGRGDHDISRGIELGCTRFHRLLRVEHRGEGGVVDSDVFERLGCPLRVHRGDGGDVVPDEADHAIQDPAIAGRPEGSVRNILIGEDAGNPGQGLRFTYVDPRDAGVRVRALQNSRVEHPVQADVARVAVTAARLLEAAPRWDPPADEAAFG
jgi:hypothetical protein